MNSSPSTRSRERDGRGPTKTRVPTPREIEAPSAAANPEPNLAVRELHERSQLTEPSRCLPRGFRLFALIFEGFAGPRVERGASGSSPGERRVSATRGCWDGFSLSLLARGETFGSSRPRSANDEKSRRNRPSCRPSRETGRPARWREDGAGTPGGRGGLEPSPFPRGLPRSVARSRGPRDVPPRQAQHLRRTMPP